MKIILYYSCISFLLLATCLNAQQPKNIDSIIQVTRKMPDDTLKVAYYGIIYENLMFKDPKKAFEFAKKEFELSKKIGYQTGLGSGQLHLADSYKNSGQIDSAKYYFDRSYQIFKKQDHTLGLLFINHSQASFEKSQGNYEKALEYANRNIELYRNRDSIKTTYNADFNLIGAEYELIGSIHIELGNYNIALKETHKALKFYEQIKDTIRAGDALMALGNIETLLGNHEKATPYYKKSYSIYDYFNDQQYKAFSANNIGDNYMVLGQFSNAQKYFNESLEIATEIGNEEIKGNALIAMAGVFRESEDLNKAKDFAERALEIHSKLEYKKNIAADLIELAKISIRSNNFSVALDHLEQAIRISSEIGAKDNLRESLQLRYTVYKKQGDFTLALSDHEMFKSVNDSIFDKTKSQQIEELRTIYDTEKKEQQIALQDKEITVLEQQAEISTLQKMLLGGLLVLSLIGFYGIRQKLKRNKLEKEKVDTELAFKKKELTTHALHLAKKNEVLESLKQKAQELKENETSNKGYQQLIRTINFDLQDDNNWENFSRYFEEVHKDFNSNVKTKYPQVTSNELRLLALLKMNLSSKEIANILNISPEGIKKARYRLRKKLDITTEDSLQDLVLSL
ncbi:tetratricopeptide repeat protein [Flagellimonas flava]|uniref:tetratricopeptide repeat protein n=1 Tax=Flagellimonas flava TaxID=570519 RepID=UPI003D65D267